MAEMEECLVQNSALLKEQKDLKLHMEIILTKAEESCIPNFAKEKLAELKGCLKNLDKVNKAILANIDKYETLKEFSTEESVKFLYFKLEFEEKIAKISADLAKPNNPEPSSAHAESNPDLSDSSHTSIIRSARVPPIQIGMFEGDEEDKLAFARFLAKFKALIGGNSLYSDEEKLIYLFSGLGDTAFDLVKHLSPEGCNYAIALDMLKAQYLDKEFIEQSILDRLIEMPSPPEKDVASLKSFLNETKALIYDLKTYGCDCLAPDTAGFRVVSAIIGGKLPTEFKVPLIDLAHTNYPKINDIFQNAPSLLKRLEAIQRPLPKHDNVDSSNDKSKFGKRKSNYSNKPFSSNDSYSKFNNRLNERQNQDIDEYLPANKPKACLENYQTTQFASKSKGTKNAFRNNVPCKFCTLAGHSMNKCPTYPDIQSRLERCRQLNICRFCSSVMHASNDCPGQKDNSLDYPCMYCDLSSHISALCEKGHK